MTPETAARKLARSKRFWTGLIGLFALMFSAFLPGLEEHLQPFSRASSPSLAL